MAKKVKKLKKEQLELLNKQQSDIGEMLKSLGILDVQKMNLHSRVKILSDEIESTKKELENEYGSINIDLSTGVITPIEKENDE
jgi:uncharacterized small protein (DUF1192 family)